VTLLELPGAAPAHAVVALAAKDPRAPASGRTWALGAGPDANAAAADALRDLVGTLQLAAEGGPTADLGDPLLDGVDAATLLALAVTEDPAPPQRAVITEELGSALASDGVQALVAVTTPPDVRACGLETVRVLLRRATGERARGERA
jgi:hypothetical protein